MSAPGTGISYQIYTPETRNDCASNPNLAKVKILSLRVAFYFPKKKVSSDLMGGEFSP